MSAINTTTSEPTTEAKEFGAYLKALRQKKGFNQADIAKLAGIAFGYYGHFEQGRRIPSVKIIRQLAQALDADLNDMLLRAGYDPKTEGDLDEPVGDVDHQHDAPNDKEGEGEAPGSHEVGAQNPAEQSDTAEPTTNATIDDATLLWAYHCIKTDPNFNFDQRMGGQDLPPATWLGFIEMYQGLTGRTLLKPEEIQAIRNAQNL